MAYKRWYERLAEMDSAKEREEFLQGVFLPEASSNKKTPFTANLVANYLGMKILSRDNRK